MALDPRDEAAGFRMTEMDELHERVIEQRRERYRLIASRQWSRLRDRPIGVIGLRDDGNAAQTVGIAGAAVRLARLGMDEDRPRLR